MHKSLVIAGIILVVASKVLILKSLFDQGAYERCIENNAAALCAQAPFPFFIYGWIITAAGAAVLIYGLRYVPLKDLR
ncbi:hypothetical protein [Nitrososphaera viennensis]|uniref:Uncharacterized protein n=2 Tax=Nitrososphaera viennensis TaxID=1034015 RepID=A0A060HTY1_9ARCH|nr:hypothetical protein [Nitrososphaera viennensis]AIC16886.1 hypothetical protein NVIE_026150 [Nitrososphaera viennensis EN76]UVS68789.1 hypothetical protein NWT39_12890 [Nitrososphaera viennensis]